MSPAELPAEGRIVWRFGDPETGDQGQMGVEHEDGTVTWLDD